MNETNYNKYIKFIRGLHAIADVTQKEMILVPIKSRLNLEITSPIDRVLTRLLNKFIMESLAFQDKVDFPSFEIVELSQ